MENLASDLAVESLSPDIINLFEERIIECRTEEEAYLLMSQIGEEYELDEDVLLSHFLKIMQSGVVFPWMTKDSDETIYDLFSDDEDHNTERPTEEIHRKKSDLNIVEDERVTYQRPRIIPESLIATTTF